MRFDVTPFVTNVRNVSGSVAKAVSAHMPEIAAVTGTVGFLSALGIMYVKSPDIHKDIEEKDYKAAVKDAAPVVITAGLSTVAVIGGMKESQKRYAAMTAAYTLTDAALQERKNAELTALSKKKVDEIDQQEAENAVANNPPIMSQVTQIGVGTCLHYDKKLKRYFRADVEAVNKSLQNMRDAATEWDTVTISDFYSNLGEQSIVRDIDDDSLYGRLGWLTPSDRDYVRVPDSNKPDADFYTIAFPSVEPVRVLDWRNLQYIVDDGYSVRID